MTPLLRADPIAGLRRLWAVVPVLALALLPPSGCASDSEKGAEAQNSLPSSEANFPSERDLPPLVDPEQFADATTFVELPQLEGLTLEQVEDWGERSGFDVAIEGRVPEGAFAPTERIIIQVSNGLVARAVAG